MATATETLLQVSPDRSAGSETSPETAFVRGLLGTEPRKDADLQMLVAEDNERLSRPGHENNKKGSCVDSGDSGRGFAAIATLAPLATTLAIFIVFGSESSARVSVVFYVVNIAGILLSVLGLRQEVLSQRKWGLDLTEGVFAKSLRARLEQIKLENFEMLVKGPPERPTEAEDQKRYEQDALRYRYHCRNYCEAARRTAFVAKYYFSSMNDESYVADQLRHVAGAEEMVAERVIHIVEELLGRQTGPGVGYWAPYNLWRLYRGRRGGQDSACLRFGGNLEKSYAKIKEIDYSLGELRFTLKAGPNMENALQRFQALETMTKESTAMRATLFIFLSQLCLNVSTVIGGGVTFSQ